MGELRTLNERENDSVFKSGEDVSDFVQAHKITREREVDLGGGRHDVRELKEGGREKCPADGQKGQC